MNHDQAPINPPPLTDENMKTALFQMAQAMTADENREAITRADQQVATMAYHLRDFTRINPPTFYGSKVEEEPK